MSNARASTPSNPSAATATISITNDSGSPVSVLLAPNAAAHARDGVADQGYADQGLRRLALAGATDPDVLAPGDTATVSVTIGSESGKSEFGPASDLQVLLISLPNSWFPIKAVLAVRDDDGNYPPVRIGTSDKARTGLALSFCRTLLASPTSSLALAFANLLTSIAEDPSGDPAAQVTAFFAARTDWATLDFASWMAADSWLRTYAYAWGMDDQGKPGRKYWVYSTPFTSTATSAVLGTIEFGNTAESNDPLDRSNGQTIAYQPADDSAAIELSRTNGLFTADQPAVALAGSFVRPTWFGTTEAQSLTPVLVGKIGSAQVFAVPVAPPKDADPAPPGDGSGLDQVALDWVSIASAIVTFASAIFGVVAFGLQWRQANRLAANDAGAAAQGQAQANGAANAADIGAQQPPGDHAAFERGAHAGRQHAAQQFELAARANIARTARNLRTTLDEVARFGRTPAIDEAFGNLVGLGELPIGEALANLNTVAEAIPGIVRDAGVRAEDLFRQAQAASDAARAEAADVEAREDDRVAEIEGEPAVEERAIVPVFD